MLAKKCLETGQKRLQWLWLRIPLVEHQRSRTLEFLLGIYVRYNADIGHIGMYIYKYTS